MNDHGLLHSRVLYLLNYDASTGIFTWRNPASNRMKSGDVAGTPNDLGYVYIAVDSKKHRAHRLAWFYVHGTWPAGELDHKNRVRADNRIANLADVSRSENMQNQTEPRGRTASGILGVKVVASGKFEARITVGGTPSFLGSFASPESAKASYLAAKQIWHR